MNTYQKPVTAGHVRRKHARALRRNAKEGRRTKMDYEKYIIDSINTISGRYTPYQVFSDWITMTAIAIQNSCTMNHGKLYEDRESQYKSIASKYSKNELKTICNMTGALVGVFEERFGDILGEIYMKSGCGSKQTGQFFTPYHLSYTMAQLAFSKEGEKERYELNEPSTGGGGSIIAFAQILKENGINYQRKMHVVAQDLDWNGVYMTYIQLSLLGIKAIVAQGDTLHKPYEKGYEERLVFRTPAEMGALL